MKTAYGCFFLCLVWTASPSAQHRENHAQHSPYAGQAGSGIAALSEQEVRDLRQGAGMGLARAAELNHYPGPLHVLELTEELRLSPAQRTLVAGFRAEMRAAAKQLGEEILEKEKHLDRRFAVRHIDESRLADLTDEIARLQGRLRFVHLRAHLQTRDALTPEQVETYDRLRGYAAPAAAAGTAARTSAAQPCEPIEGLEPLLKKRAVLVLGEVHGTKQSPAFVARVVCHALASGLSVTVGLELLDREAPGIETYLSSAATPDDRERRLTASGAWSSAYQDGRTSRAMADLLDRLRAFRVSGKTIAVELFDRSGWQSGQHRDRLMAGALATLLARTTSDFVVVLTGNIHSRIVPGTNWDPAYEPMTYLLAAETDWTLTALDVAHAGGSAWMCSGSDPASCGIREFGANGGLGGLKIELRADPTSTGHNGRYHVGSLSASAPAAERLAEPRPQG